ncbi:MAG: LytTR family DNA-binding domain-containing protein [Pedobacter sp.]|nr:LytTR family DNA-binding domain-containing protein [Pedobacter sp.]MDQ8052402.1 LytTR family DNA-binding domain-containing protein [Pedobacter sp.]
MYTCIIVDDEQMAIAGLEMYIAAMPQLRLVESYSDPLIALKNIHGPVDFIFLDIDMPKINGIELAKEIRSKTTKLIFTTAYTKYALEAFEVHADAYLLKPYSLGKFMITMNRLLPFPTAVPTAVKQDFFFVKNKEENLKITKVNYCDIVALESRRNDLLIYTSQKKILTYMSLAEMIKALQDFQAFVQVHRSFVINQDHIESVTGNQLKLTNGIELTIGETFRKEFNQFLAKRLIKAGRNSSCPKID